MVFQFFRSSFFLCFFACLSANTWAQNIPQIEVRVSDESLKPRDNGSRVEIPAGKYQKQKTSVTEVIEGEAGVHVTRYGGLNELGSVSIRGSAPGEVLVTLDDIPLNTAEGGAVDLSVLDIDDLASITLDKNATPLANGVGSFAGSLRLKSRAIQEGVQLKFRASGGSFNSFGGYQSLNVKKKQWGFVFSQSIQHTSGNYSFLDNNGTPFNLTDDVKKVRRNNESTIYHPYFKLEYEFDPLTKFSIFTHGIFKQNGVPGITSNQAAYTDLTKTEWLFGLNWERKNFLVQDSLFKHILYARWIKDQFSDLRGEIGLGGTQDTDNDVSVLGSRIEWKVPVGKQNSLTSFASFQTEQFRPEDFQATPSGGGSSVRRSISGGLSSQFGFFQERLLLEPSIWGDGVFNQLNNDDPSLASPGTFQNNNNDFVWNARGRINVDPINHLRFFGSVGRTNRFPTFAELFGDRGGVIGNPRLNPQKGLDFDTGFLWKPQSFSFLSSSSLGATYFDRRVDDLILFEQQSGFARARNVGRAHIWGIEAKAATSLFEANDITVNYTYQNAKDHANYEGRSLTGRPKHEWAARLTHRYKNFRLYEWLSFMDGNFLDPLNTRLVSDRLVLSTGLSYSFKQNWTLSIDAKNLTNSQIVDVVGFPLPGRSFWGMLGYEWSQKNHGN